MVVIVTGFARMLSVVVTLVIVMGLLATFQLRAIGRVFMAVRGIEGFFQGEAAVVADETE